MGVHFPTDVLRTFYRLCVKSTEASAWKGSVQGWWWCDGGNGGGEWGVSLGQDVRTLLLDRHSRW